jgi:hypothetical protein
MIASPAGVITVDVVHELRGEHEEATVDPGSVTASFSWKLLTCAPSILSAPYLSGGWMAVTVANLPCR